MTTPIFPTFTDPGLPPVEPAAVPRQAVVQWQDQLEIMWSQLTNVPLVLQRIISEGTGESGFQELAEARLQNIETTIEGLVSETDNETRWTLTESNIASLQTALTAIQAQVDGLPSIFTGANAESNDAITALQASVADLVATVGAIQGAFVSFNERLDGLEGSITTAETAATSAAASATAAAADAASALTTANAAATEVGGFDARIDAVEAGTAAALAQIGAAAADAASALTTANAAATAVSGFDTRMDALEADAATALAQAGTATTDAAGALTAANTATTAVASLSTRVGVLETDLPLVSSLAAGAQTQVDAVEVTVAQLQADVAALQTSDTGIQTQITNLDAAVDARLDAVEAVNAAQSVSIAGKADAAHVHVAAQISDSTPAGRALLTAADVDAQKTILGITGGGGGSGDAVLKSDTNPQDIAGPIRARRVATKLVDFQVTPGDPEPTSEITLGPTSSGLLNTSGEAFTQNWTVSALGELGIALGSVDTHDVGAALTMAVTNVSISHGVASSPANNTGAGALQLNGPDLYTARLELLKIAGGTFTNGGVAWIVEQYSTGSTWIPCFEADGVTVMTPRTVSGAGLYTIRFRPRNTGTGNFVRIRFYALPSTTVSAVRTFSFRADIHPGGNSLFSDMRRTIRQILGGAFQFVNRVTFQLGITSNGAMNNLNHRLSVGVTSFAGTRTLTIDELRPVILLSAAGGNAAMTLPTTSVTGEVVMFARTDNSANTCTVAPGGGGRLIGSSTTAVSIAENSALRLVARDTAGNWAII